VNLANSTYVEPKAAMSVGAARKRFGYKDMAWHEDIRRFAQELAIESGYRIIDEHKWSNIFLMSKRDKAKKLYKEAKTRLETNPLAQR
jgi:wyosine [tRNA(Phe)-imidazoG37] synthetase (radical SAM superfamily)